ncbi:gustatory receptor for sugar taste 43a isoform X4 [Armigeres subalbatus]|uniref:gustatory receptor for sugar taste 43a isoform X4 n=1 Tax=Armigeres subalbatus TaxID=124917 RepID=UPI002ED02907
MEISESTKAVFFVSRIFGLAPYVVKRTTKGQIVDYKRNLVLVIYSLCIVFCLAALTYKGIFFDINSKKPIRFVIRMKTATSKVVTTLDVSVVVSACICGIFCGIFGLSFVRELNQRLNEADDMLSMYFAAGEKETKKRKGFTMLTVVGVIITGALALDIWVWYRIAEKIKKENQDSGYKRTSIPQNRIIEDLAYIHASLSTGVVLVSNTFGVALLAVLGSCLLHLVATSYFLMVELVGDKDAVFSWIQALWLFIHIFRFLLTVEPCHITNVESRRTMTIVCNLMRICKDPLTKERLENFWRQLVDNNSVFTACGLCTIDRHIITSYCGAIATYLVILIQFKEADDKPTSLTHRSVRLIP